MVKLSALPVGENIDLGVQNPSERGCMIQNYVLQTSVLNIWVFNVLNICLTQVIMIDCPIRWRGVDCRKLPPKELERFIDKHGVDLAYLEVDIADVSLIQIGKALVLATGEIYAGKSCQDEYINEGIYKYIG